MEKWLKYVLIFGLIGIVIAMLLGPRIITNFFLNCDGGPCTADPMTYRLQALPFGLIIGALIGLIVAKVKK